jgi:hypothetical protein
VFRKPELGTRFFLRFALFGGALRAGAFALALSRSFLGLKFRAFAFALSRSYFALLDFSRFFSRSSIFRARTFAIIDFRARNFVLVRLYTTRIGQPVQDT